MKRLICLLLTFLLATCCVACDTAPVDDSSLTKSDTIARETTSEDNPSSESQLAENILVAAPMTYEEYFAEERTVMHNRGNREGAPSWRCDDGTLYSQGHPDFPSVSNVSVYWYGYDVIYYVANETELGVLYVDGTENTVLYEAEYPILMLCGDIDLVMFWQENGDIFRLHVNSKTIDYATKSNDMVEQDVMQFRVYSNFGCFWGWEDTPEEPTWIFYDMRHGYLDEIPEGVFPL